MPEETALRVIALGTALIRMEGLRLVDRRRAAGRRDRAREVLGTALIRMEGLRLSEHFLDHLLVEMLARNSPDPYGGIATFFILFHVRE